MKKIIGIISIIAMLATQLTVLAADAFYYNEGGITIEDSAPSVRPNEKVTLLVTPSSVDWLDEAVRQNGSDEDVVYFGEATVAEDGSYSFSFYLPENGKYNVYITEGNEPTQNGKPGLVKQIVYINKPDNIVAISALKTAVENSTESNTTLVAQVLNDYSEELGLYDKIFEELLMRFFLFLYHNTI